MAHLQNIRSQWMNGFASVVIRNFTAHGLPAKYLYLSVSYISDKSGILKCTKSKCVSPTEVLNWRDYEFEIELSRNDFYNGEIIVEIYSKAFIKDKLIGGVNIGVVDGIMFPSQFNMSYVPFSLKGQSRLVEKNISRTIIMQNTLQGRNYTNRSFHTPTGQLDFFVGVTGLNLTKAIINTLDVQNVSTIMAAMDVFLEVIKTMDASLYSKNTFLHDVFGIEYYLNNDIYSVFKPLFYKSEIAKKVFEGMLEYQSYDDVYEINNGKVHDLSFDELIQIKKKGVVKLYQNGTHKTTPNNLIKSKHMEDSRVNLK